jgi:hypothetical protein
MTMKLKIPVAVVRTAGAVGIMANLNYMMPMSMDMPR